MNWQAQLLSLVNPGDIQYISQHISRRPDPTKNTLKTRICNVVLKNERFTCFPIAEFK